MKIERQRYVRFKMFSERPVVIDAKQLSQFIWRQYNSLFGEIKSGKAGFWITDYDETTQAGTIRCAGIVLDELVAALTLLTSINDILVAFDTIKTSGVIDKLPETDSM
ncbi:MAG TPA: Rpp14/Pop5 family protein [Candidatus Lokiarchaeia archaeon]|nr:Rpp14/Pop5 family protein [Candidatus Lokiarchaeia archaeon]